jgi:uncharacterized protein YndB with AHSA1/START domain
MAGEHLREETVPDGGSVERELVIPAAVEEVWEAIAGDGWLADEVELELAPGGGARFRSPDHTRDGWIEEASPPGTLDESARLVFWWDNDSHPASRVELILTPDEEGATKVRVSETRPLEVLDVKGIPLPGSGSCSRGPSLLAMA